MALVDLQASARRYALSAVVRSSLALGVLLVVVVVLSPVTWILGPQALAAGLVVVALAPVFILLLPLERLGDRVAGHLAGEPASGRLANVAEEVAIAADVRLAGVVIVDSVMPNVGAFPTQRGIVAVATAGAVDELRRDELEALVGAQVAGAADRWCRLATRAEVVWRSTKIAALLYSPLLIVHPPALVAVALLMMMHFGPRTVESYRDLCADVAALRATRHPEALGSGLRHLRPGALLAHELKIGSFFLTTSPFFVIGRRSLFAVERKGKRFTSADAIAMDLSLRADRAQALLVGADPRDFTGREFRHRWKQMRDREVITDEEKEIAERLADRMGASTAHEQLDEEKAAAFAAEMEEELSEDPSLSGLLQFGLKQYRRHQNDQRANPPTDPLIRRNR